MREYAPNLYRYVLSEIHYLIRDVVPGALRSAAAYTEYLVSVSVSSFQILWEYTEELNPADIPIKVEETINDFQTFVETEYEIKPPSIDWNAVYHEVLTEAQSIADVDISSVDEWIQQAGQDWDPFS